MNHIFEQIASRISVKVCYLRALYQVKVRGRGTLDAFVATIRRIAAFADELEAVEENGEYAGAASRLRAATDVLGDKNLAAFWETYLRRPYYTAPITEKILLDTFFYENGDCPDPPSKEDTRIYLAYLREITADYHKRLGNAKRVRLFGTACREVFHLIGIGAPQMVLDEHLLLLADQYFRYRSDPNAVQHP